MDKLTIFFDLDDTLYDRRIPYERAFYQFFGGAYTEKLPQAFNAVIHRGYEVFTAAHTGRITTSTAIRRGWQTSAFPSRRTRRCAFSRSMLNSSGTSR